MTIRFELDRRSVLKRAGASAAACAVAGCGGRQGSSPPAPGRSGTASPVKVGDVPVGGGIIVGVRDGVVVTQPKAGQIMAFSAVCPHEGCVISEVADGEMICPCHGSRFRLADGVVTHGPATRDLTPVKVAVVDGTITFP